MIVLNIHYMITLGLLFVMFATGAYRKSYSTLAFIVGLAIMMFYVKQCEGMFESIIGLSILNIVSFLMVIRAILQVESDKILKR